MRLFGNISVIPCWPPDPIIPVAAGSHRPAPLDHEVTSHCLWLLLFWNAKKLYYIREGGWGWWGEGVECFMAFTCHGEGQKLLDSLSQLGGKVFYEEIKKEKPHFFFWEFVFCFAFLPFVSYSPVMRHKETSKCAICLEYRWVAVNEHLVGKVLNSCYGQRSGQWAVSVCKCFKQTFSFFIIPLVSYKWAGLIPCDSLCTTNSPVGRTRSTKSCWEQYRISSFNVSYCLVISFWPVSKKNRLFIVLLTNTEIGVLKKVPVS